MIASFARDTMAFTDDELAQIQDTVGALVARRQPPAHLLDQVRHELEIDGHRVRIWTVRPRWNDPTQTTRAPVAQFTYIRTSNRWSLSWMRRDRKWHAWLPAARTTKLAALVRIVDEDAEGGFWG
jgi:hypothetical protein